MRFVTIITYNDICSMIRYYVGSSSAVLNDKWTWVGQVDNILDYYNSSHLLIHASKGEGFPNVICESLACGLPVIASDIFDHPQIIKEGLNGYLFPPDKYEILASKILDYYELKIAHKNKLKHHASETALQQFSLNIYSKNYEKLFNELMINR